MHQVLGSHVRAFLSFASVLVLGACFGDRNADKGDDVKVSFGGDSTTMPPLGEDDVLITSIDGSFVMAVIGDTVRMQLSDSLRAKVNKDVSAKADDKSGLGAAITKSVGGIVNSALGFVVRVPVDQVKNLRYEDGHLRFETPGVKVRTSGTDSGNAEFREEDARRFIEAVERRQKKQDVAM